MPERDSRKAHSRRRSWPPRHHHGACRITSSNRIPGGAVAGSGAEPSLNFFAGKQKLSRHAAHRQASRGNQLVNFALLDPQQCGKFTGGEKV